MGAIALPLLNRPLHPVGIKWDDPLTRDLVCACPCTEPGKAVRSLVYGDLFAGAAAPGGKAAPLVQTQHADWCNGFGSAYSFAVWSAGFDPDTWGTIFGVSDSTISWQRYSTTSYFKNYHDGTGRSYTTLTLADVAPAQCLVGTWNLNGFSTYADGVNVHDGDMAVPPKTDSTSSVVGLYSTEAIYQFFIWSRKLAQAEAERLTFDPFCLYEIYRGRAFVALAVSGTTHDLAGSTGGTSGVVATLGTTRALLGSIAAPGAVTGSLAVAHALAGGATGAADTLAVLTALRGLAGSTGGSSSAGAVLGMVRPLAGSTAAAGNVAGSMTILRPLLGVVAGTGGATAALGVTRSVAGSVAAQGAVTGSMAVGHRLAGTIAAQGDITGTLTMQGQVSLAGGVSAHAGISGALAVSKPLAGELGSAGEATAALEVTRPLAGDLGSAGEAAATLEVTRPLAGSATAAADAGGVLALTASLGGQITVVADTIATVHIARPLAGTVTAATQLTGGLGLSSETQIALTGAVQVLVTLAAVLRIFRQPTGQAAVLAATMAADAGAVLDDLPGESAVYQPAGGSARAIQVVVDRQTPQLAETPRRQVRPLRIWARNDATAGIAAAELTHRDTILVARHIGAAPVPMRIVRRLSQSDGWTQLEVQ